MLYREEMTSSLVSQIVLVGVCAFLESVMVHRPRCTTMTVTLVDLWQTIPLTVPNNQIDQHLENHPPLLLVVIHLYDYHQYIYEDDADDNADQYQ
jgi:hypothetical protein